MPEVGVSGAVVTASIPEVSASMPDASADASLPSVRYEPTQFSRARGAHVYP